MTKAYHFIYGLRHVTQWSIYRTVVIGRRMQGGPPLCGDGRGEKARSISSHLRQVEAHVELTHGGKSRQISPKSLLVALQHTDNDAAVGAVSKSQTDAGRVACHPTVAAQRGFVILLYHPGPRPTHPFISPHLSH